MSKEDPLIQLANPNYCNLPSKLQFTNATNKNLYIWTKSPNKQPAVLYIYIQTTIQKVGLQMPMPRVSWSASKAEIRQWGSKVVDPCPSSSTSSSEETQQISFASSWWGKAVAAGNKGCLHSCFAQQRFQRFFFYGQCKLRILVSWKDHWMASTFCRINKKEHAKTALTSRALYIYIHGSTWVTSMEGRLQIPYSLHHSSNPKMKPQNTSVPPTVQQFQLLRKQLDHPYMGLSHSFWWPRPTHKPPQPQIPQSPPGLESEVVAQGLLELHLGAPLVLVGTNLAVGMNLAIQQPVPMLKTGSCPSSWLAPSSAQQEWWLFKGGGFLSWYNCI